MMTVIIAFDTFAATAYSSTIQLSMIPTIIDSRGRSNEHTDIAFLQLFEGVTSLSGPNDFSKGVGCSQHVLFLIFSPKAILVVRMYPTCPEMNHFSQYSGSPICRLTRLVVSASLPVKYHVHNQLRVK